MLLIYERGDIHVDEYTDSNFQSVVNDRKSMSSLYIS